MIQLKKLFLSIIVLLLTGITAFSQDPHFSQFYANPIYLNPAFAGTAVCPRVVLDYRNQWSAIPGDFSTFSASYDQHVDNLSGGLGLIVTSDRAGDGSLLTNTVSGIYSYRLEVNRYFSIKAGFEASFYQKSLDWSKFTFGDMIDPRYGFINPTLEHEPNQTKTFPDFSAGLLGYGESIYGGFAVNHLTSPSESFYGGGVNAPLPMRITAHLGGIIDLEKHSRRRKVDDPTISPNLLFMSQGKFSEMNYGMYYTKYPMVGGLWFRQGITGAHNGDAFIALVGFQTSVMKIGYSYDFTVSKLTNASGGSHEITCSMQFGCHPKKKRIRAINCPSF